MTTTYEAAQMSALNDAMDRLTRSMTPHYEMCEACGENAVDFRFARYCDECWTGEG